MPPIKNPLALLVFGLAAILSFILFILTGYFTILVFSALMAFLALLSNSDFV